MKSRTASILGKKGARWSGQRGFTLVEMLIATVVVLVGLVAVAQLVPTCHAEFHQSQRRHGISPG